MTATLLSDAEPRFRLCHDVVIRRDGVPAGLGGE